MPEAREALIFKASRASLTLVPARHIAAADAVVRRHLPLGLGQPPIQPAPPPQDVRLPLCQLFRDQPAQQRPILFVLQLLQHGVLLAHHVAEIQGIPLGARLQRVAERHLPLHLPLRPKMHEDFILNTPAGVGRQLDAPVGAEGVHRLDEPYGADGDQILLIGRLGVVFLEDASLKANLPRS